PDLRPLRIQRSDQQHGHATPPWLAHLTDEPQFACYVTGRVVDAATSRRRPLLNTHGNTAHATDAQANCGERPPGGHGSRPDRAALRGAGQYLASSWRIGPPTNRAHRFG